MLKKGLYKLVAFSIFIGAATVNAATGNFIQATEDITSSSLSERIRVIACCNATGSGAYCNEFSTQRSTFRLTAPYISCSDAGIQLPGGFYPTNCDVKANFCKFSLSPGQTRQIQVIQNVIVRSITTSGSENLPYGNQSFATGWPGYAPPSQWGFDGNGVLNFNQQGSYIEAEAAITAPEDGCTVITNPNKILGKIAVIRRGGCFFATKILNAQNAGAVAVVIVNNVDTGVFNMAPAAPDSLQTTLPGVLISKEKGDSIYNLLNTGNTVRFLIGFPYFS